MACDWKNLERELAAQGWTVTLRTSGHRRATPPVAGVPLVHFSRSGDFRAFANTVSDLRKSGFLWPPPARERPAAAEQAPLEEDEEADSAPPRIVEEAATLDELYARLREAKDFASLAGAVLEDAVVRLQVAQDDEAKARAERDAAAAAMNEAKRRFDEAFARETKGAA